MLGRSGHLVCQDVPAGRKHARGTASLPVATVTLLILPWMAATVTPLLGFTCLLPLAGVIASWAGGDTDGEA